MKPFKRITKVKSMRELEMMRTQQFLAGRQYVYAVVFN